MFFTLVIHEQFVLEQRHLVVLGNLQVRAIETELVIQKRLYVVLKPDYVLFGATHVRVGSQELIVFRLDQRLVS